MIADGKEWPEKGVPVGAAAVRPTVDLCTPSITTILDKILSITMRTLKALLLYGLVSHCSAAYPIPAYPNKTV